MPRVRGATVRGGRPAVHRTEVDGVPTVWVDAPGPLQAGLILRAGMADETVPTHGTAHLLEHLTLFGTGRPGDHNDGCVDQTVTTFSCEGDPGEVVAFLDRVTRNLHRPDLARLAAERDILRAERAGAEPTLEGTLLSWRFGAGGYGLADQPEVALDRIGAADLAAWAARFAVRQNAVLWLTGPPPPGLRLHLPDGAWQAPPDPRLSILPQLPAWFCLPGDAVAAHAVVDRTVPTGVLAYLLQARLTDELRTRRAAAYAPAVDRQAYTADAVRLLLHSDFVPGREQEVADAFIEVLAGMARGAVGSQDLRDWRQDAERLSAGAFAVRSVPAEVALDLVLGRGVDTPEGRAEAAADTPEDVVLAAAATLRSALLLLPPNVEPPDGWAGAPAALHSRIDSSTATTFRSVDAPERLDISAEGITIRCPDDGSDGTVLSRTAVAVLSWPDGRRVVLGHDGISLDVEPTLWLEGERLTRRVDETFPERLRLPQRERDPEEIPMPRGAVGPGWWRRNGAFGIAAVLTGGSAGTVLTLIVLGEWWSALAASPILAVVHHRYRRVARRRRHLVALRRRARAAARR